VVDVVGVVVGVVVDTGPGEASVGGVAVVDVVAGDEVAEPAPPEAATAAAGSWGPVVTTVVGDVTTVVGAAIGPVRFESRARPGGEMDDGDVRRPPAWVPRA